MILILRTVQLYGEGSTMQDKIKAAPTVVYPESDGKPMAETEYHN